VRYVSEENLEKKKKKISALVAKTRMRNFGHTNTPPAKKAFFIVTLLFALWRFD
jgi:hypothetical protein